jgi:hypothetical protein
VRLSYRTHEEKETDVAIACKLLELLCQGRCDTAVLMTGDTDIAPAIRTAKLLYPTADIAVAFPFKRHNRDLERFQAACEDQCTALPAASVRTELHYFPRQGVDQAGDVVGEKERSD